MDIAEKLKALAADLAQRLPAAKRSEANTSQFLVQPFFEALGYSVHNPNDVEPEFTADIFTSSTRVDYALKIAGKPVVLVEVKRANLKLERHHTRQLHFYFSSKLDVRFGILTNGLEYRFYADLDRPNVMDDEPFMTLDLRKLDESLLEVLEVFSKAGFERDKALNAARDAKDQRIVRQVLKAEFDPLSHGLRQYVLKKVRSNSDSQRLERLVEQEWLAFLTAKRATAPVSQSATSGIIETGPGVDKAPETIEEQSQEKEAGHADKQIAADDCIPIYGYYKGHRFRADLRLESVRKGIYLGSKAVIYNGGRMRPSDAVWNAIRSVDPSFDNAAWDRDKINSWEFWHVVDPLDGSERILRLVAGWENKRDKALYERILSS